MSSHEEEDLEEKLNDALHEAMDAQKYADEIAGAVGTLTCCEKIEDILPNIEDALEAMSELKKILIAVKKELKS